MFDGKGIYAIDDIPPVNGSRVYSGEMKISSRDNITQSGFICDDGKNISYMTFHRSVSSLPYIEIFLLGIMDLRRKTHRVMLKTFYSNYALVGVFK